MNQLIKKEIENKQCYEVSKNQNIRIIDIFLIGPSMICLGILSLKYYLILSIILIIFGILTIYYNFDNYKKTNQLKNSKLHV